MATGDGSRRPPRRRLPSEGEPGTAPVVYLPGAWGAPMVDAGSSRLEHEDDRMTAVGAVGGPSSDDGIGTGTTTSDGTPAGGAHTGDSPQRERRERRAENISVSALTRRGMSRHELERTLLARELDAEIVEAELERLESVGLIDDAALAETLVRTQHERKGLGRSALTAELRRRHIDQEHIDAALEQVDDVDETARAGELAERRARQLTSLDRDTAERRLTGYLMRKGYSSSVVRAAVDAALPARRTGGVRFR